MRRRRFVAGLVVCAATVTVVACGDRAAPALETSDASAGSVAVSAGAPATSASAPSRDLGPVGPTAVAAHGYVPGLARSTGSEGAVTYDVQVPTLTGGNAAAAERFTASMRASLADRVRTLGPAPKPITVTDGRVASGERSRVSRIGAKAVGGVLLTNYFMQGAAHPNNQIGTVVINTGTAQPILLSDVLPTAKAIAGVKDLIRRQVTEAGPTPSLNEATTLANWLPTAAGITFYVPVAHAAGDFWPFALPWRDLDGIVPAEVIALLRA
ncbi:MULTISPECIES: hypothetical protein [Tsukamurella]|uniref:DUF3298 domain-containing protein n=2 Tax=Tsukamurella TaxID=2060 RepID=A0A5C5S7H7_9ACTN|nr:MULTISPECIES: hypothetical protein [Tsukamurella]NMD55686.1 hypothetical protein [Tsukamurella columbiensis]TWS30385.1 hypothetical protein FK530_00420 [Tsukamurella conjunctivitidis]